MNFAHLSGINAILTIFNIHHYSHSMELVKWDSLKIQASSSECMQNIHKSLPSSQRSTECKKFVIFFGYFDILDIEVVSFLLFEQSRCSWPQQNTVRHEDVLWYGQIIQFPNATIQQSSYNVNLDCNISNNRKEIYLAIDLYTFILGMYGMCIC